MEASWVLDIRELCSSPVSCGGWLQDVCYLHIGPDPDPERHRRLLDEMRQRIAGNLLIRMRSGDEWRYHRMNAAKTYYYVLRSPAQQTMGDTTRYRLLYAPPDQPDPPEPLW